MRIAGAWAGAGLSAFPWCSGHLVQVALPLSQCGGLQQASNHPPNQLTTEYGIPIRRSHHFLEHSRIVPFGIPITDLFHQLHELRAVNQRIAGRAS